MLVKVLKALCLPFFIPGVALLCVGHYRNHTAEWLAARGYRSQEEIIGRIFAGVWDWVAA